MGSFLLTQESESHVDDLVYLMRTSDAWRGRVLDPSGIGYGAVGLAQDEDWPAIEAMVRDHEGERSVELLQFWRHKGADLLVVRSPEGRIEGFALELRLDRLTPKEAAADPGVAPA